MVATSVGLVCPACRGDLDAEELSLRCACCGERFPYLPGVEIPDLTFPKQLAGETVRHRQHFDELSGQYDEAIARLLEGSEPVFRRTLVQQLQLKPYNRVLEVGVGTGSNLPHLLGAAEGISVEGVDLSPGMVTLCAQHPLARGHAVRLAVANAEHLPYPDGAFDAVVHFGFVNEFGDPGRGIAEMARVVKPGGRVVISDDSIPRHLRGLPWARALITANPSFGCDPPLTRLPAGVTGLEVQWFASVFYIISFTKAPAGPGAGG
ncbi:class I SAM-dependent methyltransferase [Calidithermus roseus]|uniref:Demethylrebeccamycin-D-glucose O-methyltransferase n=1 Tax=Calidithermus roseus TaxID=1644118 RepID=A0A399ENP5_9DEIN|nr:class I SAM-dependent methyltransferase [Calidithermus roseus]RIH84092.1 Demethylrebeccamycin-D-glucose O-methyltransferase [Calidithermus roseus]